MYFCFVFAIESLVYLTIDNFEIQNKIHASLTKSLKELSKHRFIIKKYYSHRYFFGSKSRCTIFKKTTVSKDCINSSVIVIVPRSSITVINL